MALITCSECSAQLSDKAKVCPSCGAPVKKKTSKLNLVFAGVLLAGIFAAVVASNQPAPPKTEQQLRAEAERNVLLGAVQRVKSATKNPDSFSLTAAILLADGSICVEYRATNSFNAVVPGQAVVKASSTSGDAKDWEKFCAGKSGKTYNLQPHF